MHGLEIHQLDSQIGVRDNCTERQVVCCLRFFSYLSQEHSSACVSNSGCFGCVVVGSSVTVLAGGLKRVQSVFTTGKKTAHSCKIEADDQLLFLVVPYLLVFNDQTVLYVVEVACVPCDPQFV